MPEIVIAHRAVARVLALLPALVLAGCVRVLTLATPPVPLRVIASGVIALACWTSYRLLTASVTIAEAGVRVRGVLYDADIPWADVRTVNVEPASGPVRFLLWGMVEAQSVTLACTGRILRPVALFTGPDDEEVERAVGAIRVRSGVWRVPVQRQPDNDGVSVG